MQTSFMWGLATFHLLVHLCTVHFTGLFAYVWSVSESAVRKSPKKIQKQQRVAEALGGIHQLLYVLL